MPILSRQLALAALSFVGCADPCGDNPDVRDIGGGTRAIDTELVGELGTLAMQIRWPAAAFADMPIAVVIEGGFDDGAVHGGRDLVGVGNADGIVSVHADLVGQQWSDGSDDTRGALARKAVAAALDYALGSTADGDQCHITQRAAGARSDHVILVGSSNGGNLAAAELADPEIDAAVAGVVFWETPAGGVFVNVEHRNRSELYTAGSCTLGEGIACPFASNTLVVSENGRPCFDLDADGGCSETDAEERGKQDSTSGLHMPSPALARLESGLGLTGYADEATAAAFWSERDAAQLAAAMVENRPELPVILVATEVDHVLDGLADHPHVYGLGEALSLAGARWVRLNPGADWTGLDDENSPALALRLATPNEWLFPESVSSEAELSAAIRELADRTERDEW